jgi:O-antigen/teichoic acid export membrane protein
MEKIRGLILSGTRSVLALTIPVAFAMYYFSPYLLHTLMRTNSPEAVAILKWMSVGVAIEALGATAMHVIWGRDDIKKLFNSTLAAALVNIVLMIVFVRKFGVTGVGAAFVVSITLAVLAYVWIALHAGSLSIKSFAGNVLKSVAVPSVLMVAVCWAMLHRGIEYGLPHWIGSAAIVCAVFWCAWLMMEFWNKRGSSSA